MYLLTTSDLIILEQQASKKDSTSLEVLLLAGFFSTKYHLLPRLGKAVELSSETGFIPGMAGSRAPWIGTQLSYLPALHTKPALPVSAW